MAGQSATMGLGKARSMAKGAGHDLGCNHGGSKASAPTEGRTIGDSRGKSANAGDMRPKSSKKMKHNY
ncbi:MAG TPA: hypothetical protein VGF75_08080 [Candidatus Saccharimonadales bacterium]|jgi:hypothetical protein